ncbi:MAG: NUDIX hydrolase [Burkholderiales bacterium]|nr:NUDIX hydrolase [Burkholderiales bacterium]
MRTQIALEIESILPFDETENVHRAEALAWVASGAGLCRLAKPATPPTHLVAYFAVTDGQKILLVDHKNAQLWLPTGGHVEAGEHPRVTVTRELQEELGFSAAHEIGPPQFITATTTVGLTSGHTDVSLWYVVHAAQSQAIDYDQTEFNDVRWFDFADIPFERSDPHMRRFVEKLKAGLASGSSAFASP